MTELVTNTRLGFHYFNDTLHYREKDLQAWLPQLQSMGAQWLVINSESQRAIPETFIRGMIKGGIQPIVHMPLSLAAPTTPLEISSLFTAYANWGVKHVVLFNEPNQHESWGDTSWSNQQNMVERFLDIYLPLALQAMQDGLQPGLPPLKRGGDYWDTAFLRAALQGIKQRQLSKLLDKLFISANATTNGHPVAWGAGGPERWPGARPYFTHPGEEDQQGFYVFDWYTAISEAVLNRKLPIALLKSGSTSDDAQQHTAKTLEITQALMNSGTMNNPVAEHIFTCNFWVLAAGAENVQTPEAWYQQNGTMRDAVKTLKAQQLANAPKKRKKDAPPEVTHKPPFSNDSEESTQALEENFGKVPTPNPSLPDETVPMQVHVPERNLEKKEFNTPAVPKTTNNNGHVASNRGLANIGAIEHYLLLPTYEWGVADWHLEVIQPFVKKHRPTVGFSITEAMSAQKVTLVGGVKSFPVEIVEQLQNNGCEVQRIQGSGTSIATQLETL